MSSSSSFSSSSSPSSSSSSSSSFTSSPLHGRASILLFGDSISQYAHDPAYGGWGTILQHHYQRKADIINRGYSGYNSRMAKAMSAVLFPTPPPSVSSSSTSSTTKPYLFTTLFFGANDAADNSFANELNKPPQGIAIQEYQANLVTIIERMQHYTDLIFVISPPPVDNDRWKDRNNSTVQQYTLACHEIVHEMIPRLRNDGASSRISKQVNVIHINLYERMMITNPDSSNTENYTKYLNDGLHLSTEGNAMVSSLIMANLEQAFSTYLPDSLPLDFDIWRDIDPEKMDEFFSPEHLKRLHAVPAPFRK